MAAQNQQSDLNPQAQAPQGNLPTGAMPSESEMAYPPAVNPAMQSNSPPSPTDANSIPGNASTPPAPPAQPVPPPTPPPASATPVPPLGSQPTIETPAVQPGAAPMPSTITPPSPSRKFPKKLLFLIVGILVLLAALFAVVRLIIPRLGGSGGGGQADLVWWGLWEDESIVQPIIEEYEAANPGVTIRYEKRNKEDYRERLTSALATEEKPDIFRLHSSWVPMFRQELAPAPEDVITSQEFQETFYPVAAADLIGANGPLAMPLEYDGLAMFINEDIFATYGQPIPTDWNTLRSTARALTIKDERGVITQSGASLGTTANVDHWPEIVALLMLQNGGNPNNPNDTNGLGGQALQFYKQFAATDGVWDSTLPESTVAFATGRVAMYFGPSWRALEISDRNPSLNFRLEPVPQIPQANPNAPDITYATYWVEGVSAESENPDEAWRFLKYLSERETLTKMFENASQVRAFGEPYPRVDMKSLMDSHSILRGVISLAPTARSGFLHSRTFDGDSAINSSLAQYYEDALNSIDPTRSIAGSSQMSTLSTGVQQVLSRYGLAAPVPPPAP